ncbi:S-layer homology domain-containing protein [Halobacillus trueperi]|uniref:DUF5011 domain-containing protein n=1 Tax=Halobacillus trueperi TaxID=156205 RepID=A0A3E0JBX7_9BACI|nr:S-layer homology domain-containing protein [Halobacillus trueperi]REJ10294.1 DUF5011 domain-containing protein [Halobacillus trueperi]
MKRTNIYRMFVILVMALSVVATINPVKTFAQEFTDVPEGTVYYEPIHALAEKQIVSGYEGGEFKIRNQITRAEASVMLANLLNLDKENAPPAPFEDVQQGVWYSGAINALYHSNIVVGVGENKFGTKANITRAALARMIVQGYGLELEDEKEMPFTDVVGGAWYMEDLKTLYSHGLISGTTTTTFSPNAKMRRGDFALLSYNTEVAQGTLFLEVQNIEVLSENQLAVNFTDNETVKIDLDEELVDGENKVSFEYKGKVFEDILVQYEVPDTEPPVITIDGFKEYFIQKGLSFNQPIVSATDDVDGEVTVDMQITRDGEPVGQVDTDMVGKYTLIYTAEDQAGNKAEKTEVSVEIAESVLGVEVIDEETLSLTLPGGNTKEMNLEEVLTHGENVLSYTTDSESYQFTVVYDALTPAINAAEKAINELPDPVAQEDATLVEDARSLVNKAFAIDESATIQGLNKLKAAEYLLSYYQDGSVSVNHTSYSMKKGKEVQLEASLSHEVPFNDYTWSSSDSSVATVTDEGLVTAVGEGSATITVETPDGKKATSRVSVWIKPSLQFNSYGSVTVNNVIQRVSTSFYNLTRTDVTVEKIEIFEDNSRRSSYTEAELKNSGIDPVISYGEQFGISISFKYGGLWTTSNNKVVYQINDGEETFEYVSTIR